MAQHFYLAEPACAHHVYVGAADTDGNTAIFRCSFAGGVLTRDDADDAAAAWAPAAVREGDKGAGWISAAPSGDSLYVSVRGGPEPEQHYVAHYAIDRKDGALTEASTQQTVLLGSPHCSVDPSGRMLVSSQMKGGGVTSFPLAADGALQPAATVLPLEGGGSGANPKRSTQHFCHSAQMAVGGSHVFVPDLGADKLWSFALHPESGTMSPATPADHWVAPPGSGPRHLACHPNGEWVFLITEMGCTIEPLLYSAATGSLERLAPSVSTLPPDWAGTMSVEVGDSLGCTTADVHCSPDGKYVYGSNRANDTEGTIVIFAIDATTGGLSLVGHVGCGGVTPRNFALHPSGEWLVVANQTTGNLVVFDVDRETGWLKQSSAAGSEEGGADGAGGGVLPLLQTPLCVQFVPVLE